MGYDIGEDNGYENGYTDGYEDATAEAGGYGDFVDGFYYGDGEEFNEEFTATGEGINQIILAVEGNIELIEFYVNVYSEGLYDDLATQLEDYHLNSGVYTFAIPQQYIKASNEKGYIDFSMYGHSDSGTTIEVYSKCVDEVSFNNGFDSGKEAQYNEFWDGVQDKGNRTNYQYAFLRWGNETIKPKYPIIVDDIGCIFRNCEKLKQLPVVKPLGDGFTNMLQSFQNCFELETIPFVLETSPTAASVSMQQTFAYSPKIKTISCLKVNGNEVWKWTFDDCFALENLTIQGTIATSGVDLRDSTKLTHKSLMSVINALKDYSGTSTTCSITFGATNLAKLTAAEKKIATDKGWSLA